MNKMLKPTIISISMATVMAGAAISPALSLIAKAFPGTDPVFIKLILTAPAIMIIPFSFIASFLTSKITKRTIVLGGLIIYLIGGVGAQFANSIYILLAFRLILGMGVGLVMPLSMSLIADHFSGRERTKMMGYNSAFSNFGGIITIIFAGYLATFGWRVPFNVYFLGLLIFIMVFFFLPKDTVEKRKKKTKKEKIPFAVYGYTIGMGGIMLVYYAVPTNMALYLEQSQIGGPDLAGTIISFTTVGGMITSIFLARLQDLFKNLTILITLIAMAIAFLVMTLTHIVPLVILSVCFVGFGQGILFPTVMLKAMNAAPSHQADRVVAMASSFTYIGQFISPIVLDSIGRLFHASSIRYQYGSLSVGIFIFVVIMIIYKLTNKARRQNIPSES